MNQPVPTVLVLDADPDTLALLREWLSDAGWAVAGGPPRDEAPAAIHLVLVDLAFPRRGEAKVLQHVTAAHAGTPVLALSAMFHASVERSGEVARSLGVAGVLPKPIRREALVAAVQQLSRAPP